MLKYAFLFFLWSPTFVQAENVYRFDLYGSSTYKVRNHDSLFNPNNMFEVPTWTQTLELRPDFQFNFDEKQSLVLRSRHFLQSFETKFTNPDRSRSTHDEDSDLSDLFFSSSWTDSFATTIGLQNYQWGPAEIFSASNPFFHFNTNQRSFFFKEKGRVLARVNWNPNPESNRWSVVGIYEPIDNQTRFWTADKEFTPRSALKVEYQFENPANAFAVIGGQGEDRRGFIAEYFTWSWTEGISFYGDVQHHHDRTNYVPEKNSFNFYDLVDTDEDRIFTLAVLGFRWEGRVDFRQEFIFNEAGYNSDQWKQVRASATTLSPRLVTNLNRFSSPGLEFRTQTYSYTSLRIPDLGASKKASVNARWLSSLDHNSAVLQLNYEYNWNDHAVISIEGLQFMGDDSSEFRIIDDQQASIGVRWSY